MKFNKFTAALIGLGVLSLASVAQASNPVVYLAGASALRSTLFSAATTPGVIFDAGHAGAVVSPAPNNTSTSTYIVFEGPINGTTVDIDIFWTGAEAGVADVAGNTLTQTLNNSALGSGGVGTYNVPGIPGTFLTQSSGWTTTSPLSGIPGAPATADLALDDTSQAVSLTPKALYNLKDYGALAVVPFSFLKGYQKTPDATWTNIVNVTTAQINQVYSGPIPANYVSGNPADANGDQVAITGRNLSSGTRVNALLTSQYGVTTTVDQWAYEVNYNTPGLLAAGTSYASPGALTEIFNDGFNTSGGAAAQLNFDGSGSGYVLIEPLAVPDAANAHSSPPAGGGAATYLSYNGVYESDSAVENGSYTFWGYEHIFGTVGQSPTSTAGQVGIALSTGGGTGGAIGIPHYLLNIGAGNASGAVGPTYSAQSALIPLSLLQVTRSGDGGFPAPK
jgi:hypothetical protein